MNPVYTQHANEALESLKILGQDLKILTIEGYDGTTAYTKFTDDFAEIIEQYDSISQVEIYRVVEQYLKSATPLINSMISALVFIILYNMDVQSTLETWR